MHGTVAQDMPSQAQISIVALAPEISSDDFARRFAHRAANLMWFLGAGVSASSGVPTAWDMIWDFKRLLYVTQRRVSPNSVQDLSNPAIQRKIQAHIDSLGNLPGAGAPEEYADLFESAFPAESDRRAYMDSKISGAKPSFGHVALAVMMKAGLTKIAWTTNFDPLVADACAKVFESTGPLTTVALDAPALASESIGSARWPLEIKIHDDFRSRRLKNTADELRYQDSQLRQVLVDSCRRWGLVVVGYSGRDVSVMDSLEASLTSPGAYPGGLFWLHRGDDRPLARVDALLRKAVAAGVDAALVRIENFDEALRDLLRLIQGADLSPLDVFSTDRRRWSPAPVSAGKTGWPVIRLNAIEVEQTPTVCRRIVCGVGGFAAVQEAIVAAGVDLIATRTKAGVLAFGSDSAARTAFAPWAITEFDLHSIEAKRLRFDSGERGLLRAALTRALVRRLGLQTVHRRNVDLLAPLNHTDKTWAGLKAIVGDTVGLVNGHPELIWMEGVATRLEWAHEKLWLLLDPRTVFTGQTEANKEAATEFARERTIKRYNRVLNELVEFWSKALSGEMRETRALNISDGVDAAFKLSSTNAFSRRSGA